MAKGKATNPRELVQIITDTLEKQGFDQKALDQYKQSEKPTVSSLWNEYRTDPANFVRENGSRYSLKDVARNFAKEIGPDLCESVGIEHQPITRGSKGQKDQAKQSLSDVADLLDF